MYGSILRLEETQEGTIGVLSLDGRVICYTLEPEWEHNLENVSCIPEGIYRCERTLSPRFGDTFKICDIPGGRGVDEPVLFHWGNRGAETRGCPLLGLMVGWLYGDRAVLASRKAFKAFMKVLKGEDVFMLSIQSMITVRG